MARSMNVGVAKVVRGVVRMTRWKKSTGICKCGGTKI